MGRRIDFGEIVARRKCAPLPENWGIFQWERIGNDAVIYSGAEFTLFTKGPRKGHRKFGKRKDDWKCVVTQREVEEEAEKWESETGKCSKCGGDGQEWIGWNHETGDHYRPCSKCGGGGLSVAKREAIAFDPR